jgi:fumarate hydratase, class II
MIKTKKRKIYWGKNTKKCIKRFKFTGYNTPKIIIKSYAIYKKCCAITNNKFNLFNDPNIPKTIVKTCDEIIKNKHIDQFVLNLFQSHTNINLNMNEVIANISMEMYNRSKKSKKNKLNIHPINHVNKSQSSNDSFPCTVHISVAFKLNKLLIILNNLIIEFKKIKNKYKDVKKIGRTHLQDALPITIDQEISGYIESLNYCKDKIKHSLNDIYYIPCGGTAIGDGTNSPQGFDKKLIIEIKKETKLPFKISKNKFSSISSFNSIQNTGDSVTLLATNLIKICNDYRIMSSGPQFGFNDIILNNDILSSSIMAGKNNPVDLESLIMICTKIIRINNEITILNSQGNFQLNSYVPSISHNIIESLDLITDGCNNFTKNFFKNIEYNKKKLQNDNKNTLSISTYLVPYIGYEETKKLLNYAKKNKINLIEANNKLNYISEKKLLKILKLTK